MAQGSARVDPLHPPWYHLPGFRHLPRRGARPEWRRPDAAVLPVGAALQAAPRPALRAQPQPAHRYRRDLLYGRHLPAQAAQPPCHRNAPLLGSLCHLHLALPQLVRDRHRPGILGYPAQRTHLAHQPAAQPRFRACAPGCLPLWDLIQPLQCPAGSQPRHLVTGGGGRCASTGILGCDHHRPAGFPQALYARIPDSARRRDHHHRRAQFHRLCLRSLP